jgi:hypothetical protein
VDETSEYVETILGIYKSNAEFLLFW